MKTVILNGYHVAECDSRPIFQFIYWLQILYSLDYLFVPFLCVYVTVYY